jgi:hypothetical protein
MSIPNITIAASHQKGLNSPAAEMQKSSTAISIVIAEISLFVKEADNMKKFLWVVLAVLLMCPSVYGAGTSVITSVTPYPDGYTHVLVTFVADAADHTVPDLVISGYRGQHLYEVWKTAWLALTGKLK